MPSGHLRSTRLRKKALSNARKKIEPAPTLQTLKEDILKLGEEMQHAQSKIKELEERVKWLHEDKAESSHVSELAILLVKGDQELRSDIDDAFRANVSSAYKLDFPQHSATHTINNTDEM